jgi:hypothetical protein
MSVYVRMVRIGALTYGAREKWSHSNIHEGLSVCHEWGALAW